MRRFFLHMEADVKKFLRPVCGFRRSAAATLIRKTIHNFPRKESFADAKAMGVLQ